MEYRKFGPTDLTVSAIGFGCYDAAGWESGFDQMSAAVHRAVDLGITCFDTAEIYGRRSAGAKLWGESERMLGRALGSRRKDMVVVTKCGTGYVNMPPKGRDSRREAIFASVEQSLQNLQTDYVDVLMPHWPDTNTPFEETTHALDSLVQQGKVRAVGLSNFALDQVKECEAARQIDAVQYHFNMIDRRVEQEISPHCQQQGIGVMVSAPLGTGLLAGTFTEDTKFGEGDFRGRGDHLETVKYDGAGFVAMYDKGVFQRNVRLVDDLKPIAESRGKTMPQLALRWVLSNPAVSVAIPGMLNVQELEENLGVLDWALSGEDMREIDEVFARHGVETHGPQFIDP